MRTSLHDPLLKSLLRALNALPFLALPMLALPCLALPCLAQAAPHIPASGSTVIEQLPRRADAGQRELRRMRAELAASPNDLALATRAAQFYISTGRNETDPRYYGYAQAALKPWWTLSAPPPQVRLLRATLLQATHRFPEALADLDAVVAADPQNAQAWLTRATVQTVRGDYEGATRSCARLSGLTTELVTITCITNVTTMTGRARSSETLLEMAARRSADADTGTQVWVQTQLAEMALRRGDAASAETRFQRGLQLAPRDSYLLGAYADLLLDQRRAGDVVKLLRGQLRIDALLLRHALALQQLPGEAPALKRAVADLTARFDAAMLRGDTVHQREQARFELQLRGDSKTALVLAKQNWAIQKEPADMRILLEAAQKAGDPLAAEPVLTWIARHKLEDVALTRLARQIGGA